MFRRTLIAGFAIVAVVGLAGCRWPWESKAGPITGTVRYPSGEPVWGAQVIVEQGDTTYTGADGHFFLPVPPGVPMLTISARDGFTPGRAYAETQYGQVRAAVGRDVIVVKLVLDHTSAI